MNKRLIATTTVLILFLLPPVDSSASKDPVILVSAHYALYAAGFFLADRASRNPAYLVIAVIVPVLWMSPYGFALAASSQLARIVDYITLILSGYAAGVFIRGSGLGVKIALLALYMLGDSALTAEFLLGGTHYSSKTVPYSPFSPSEFVLAGLLMAGVMSIIAVVAVARIVRTAVQGTAHHGFKEVS